MSTIAPPIATASGAGVRVVRGADAHPAALDTSHTARTACSLIVSIKQYTAEDAIVTAAVGLLTDATR
jgi:hypothetical protein